MEFRKAKEQVPQLGLYYKGIPPLLEAGKTYELNFGRILSTSGKLSFSLKTSSLQIAKHKKYLEFYANHPDLSQIRINPNDIKLGLLVMIISEDRKTMFRAQVSVLPESNGVVGVLDVDKHKFYRCSKQLLYLMDRHYLDEPCESFACLLEGTEFFLSSPLYMRALSAHKEFLLKNHLVGTCTSTTTKLEGPVFRICSDEDVEIGTDFNSLVLSTIYRSCPGHIPSIDDKRASCFVSHIEPSGAVYIHMDSSFVNSMENILRNVDAKELFKAGKPFRAGELSKSAVYVVPLYGTLFRAKFLSHGEINKVIMELIDSGIQIPIHLSEIRRAGLIDKHLEWIPPLCHKVYLRWVKRFSNVENAWNEMAGEKYKLKLRTGKVMEFPQVELSFTRADGITVSMNKILVLKNLAEPDGHKVNVNHTTVTSSSSDANSV